MAQTTVVRKYGGACLSTPEKIVLVARELAKLHGDGQRVVVVVSAMGSTTDQLIKMAYAVSAQPNRRELDMLLTAGERISMSLLSMALAELNVPAISFTGSQAGLLTDPAHSSARILEIRPVRVKEELERGKLIVLAGFQGVNPVNKEVTTLGRGGSDTTAVAMAAALKADRCEIIKEVAGVCTADPRLVTSARPIQRLDFASLSEMCFWGAKVLHFRCVEMARSQNIPLTIQNSDDQSLVTNVVREVSGMESGKILSVNSLARVERVVIDAANLSEGFDRLAQHLNQNSLNWPQLLTSTYEDGRCQILFTADAEALDFLLRSFDKSTVIRREGECLSSVTLTCFGGVSSDLPHRALKVLSHHQIVAEKYVFSPHSVTLFVKPEQRESAVQALHALI